MILELLIFFKGAALVEKLVHLHPMLVHFPIALYMTSVLFDFGFKIFKKEDFLKTAYFLLILALLAGLAATADGLLIEGIVEKTGVPEEAIDRHMIFAIFTIVFIGTLLGFRFIKKNKITANLYNVYLALSLAGMILIGLTGLLGGKLVYEYGAAVKVKSGETAK